MRYIIKGETQRSELIYLKHVEELNILYAVCMCVEVEAHKHPRLLGPKIHMQIDGSIHHVPECIYWHDLGVWL
jgi:hypothetical protein